MPSDQEKDMIIEGFNKDIPSFIITSQATESLNTEFKISKEDLKDMRGVNKHIFNGDQSGRNLLKLISTNFKDPQTKEYAILVVRDEVGTLASLAQEEGMQLMHFTRFADIYNTQLQGCKYV